jgi:hypothetical protein
MDAYFERHATIYSLIINEGDYLMFWALVFWCGFAAAVGILAGNKGRNGFGWFVLALIISPLLAGILALAVSDLASEKSQRTGYVECPHCAEMVKAKARICPHCRLDLIPTVVDVTPTEKSKWQSDSALK